MIPSFINDLLQMLFDLAIPAAVCTLVLAGLALRQEGGLNFEAGGRFQRWILWTVIFLTLPQLLSWFAAQGISMPGTAGSASGWLGSIENSVRAFVMDLVLSRLIPVVAAFFVLKSALDAAQGQNPLASIIAAFFLLSVSSTVQLFQSWNSGSQFATTDMLANLWNYLAGIIMPLAAGLAVVGAILNYVRHKPVMLMVGAGLAFLSVSGLWKLVQVMAS
ncbi:MAG TPA: hypothetical protein VK699_01170 [Terriglobales bacterium]|jgi:hypothetical protein|nr:hypothetical protein [Terriglobales bacterium]